MNITRRMIATAFGITVLIVTLIQVSGLTVAHRANDKDDLTPIDEITGIYSSASLRPGCLIEEGYAIPFNDDGPWCHHVVGTVAYQGEPSFGLPAEWIRIVDVYGDKCTIIFRCTNYDDLFECTDYPLAFLDYDEEAVRSADDGRKTELYGSRYTLAGAGKARMNKVIKIIIIAAFAILVPAIVFIRRKNRFR